MRRVHSLAAILCLLALAAGCAGTGARGPAPAVASGRAAPFTARPLRLDDGGRWCGDGVAYGPHRDGQRPGGPAPARDQLREDLRLLAPRWGMIRLYGAVGPAADILDLVREEKLGLRVMLGVWIEPGEAAANRREIEAAVRLAAEFPEIVLAVCVGNETQVSWSAHRVPADLLIACVREVRSRVAAPVSVADDFGWWVTPESRTVAAELDFLVVHAHPLWNGRQLDEAVDWTRATLDRVRDTHPGSVLLLGETGWATRRNDLGDQGRLMKGQLGEPQQKVFRDALTDWIRRDRIPTFFFEAFDENWKGGDDPDEVEKHWGLYRADRTPKQALAGGD